MGKHPDLSKLDDLFAQGIDFQLTGEAYAERTGVALPKEKNYIIHNSALSRKAVDKGYTIVEVQERPIIERTVYFRKKRG